jgi:hypothetical protein
MSKQTRKPNASARKQVILHQQSTLNHQLPQKQPAGNWIERLEQWLADGGFLKVR